LEQKFKTDIEPADKIGYKFINPQVYTEKYAPDFQGLDCNKNETNEFIPLENGWLETSKGPQVITNDPRLNSASHSQWITLDQPPIDSSMKLYDIPFDKSLDRYGQDYKTYSDINAGQILYYVDKSIEDPYYKPIFVESSQIDSYLYQDPMGSTYGYYYRTPLKNDNHIGPTRDNYEGGLSWIQDSISQREDIMALQMSKLFSREWTTRYHS